VRDAHYAQRRALRAGDLHRERISGGPDAVELAGLRPAAAFAGKDSRTLATEVANPS